MEEQDTSLYKDLMVPSDLCHVLSILGFKDKCIGYWVSYLSSQEPTFVLNEIDYEKLSQRMFIPEHFPHLAPTWTQIFDWFEKKHGLKGWTSPLLGTGQHHYYIVDVKTPYMVLRSDNENDIKFTRRSLLERLIKTLDIKNEADSLN